MAEPCKNCGAELFAGQRFCRACGNPTDPLAAGEAPTQQFADEPAPQGEAPTRRMAEPDDWGARSVTHTAPQSRPDTNPVGKPPSAYQAPSPYQAPPTSYQLPPPPPAWRPPQYLPPPPPTSSRSSSTWAIVLAIFLALMLGAMIAGQRIYKRVRDRIQASQQIPQEPPAPPAPAQLLTLNKGAAVTVKTSSGNISLESWDNPQAEVQIVGRASVPPTVKVGPDNNSLDLIAPQNGNVGFRVKLPRELGAITISTASGEIRLTNVSGQISLATASGNLRLENVAGLERIRTASGDITGRLGAGTHPLSIETASGDIRLTLQDSFNANFDARTLSGDISVNDAFNEVKVSKSLPGMQASGTIGTGGPAFTIRTASGDIRIDK
jgi:Toastrack DUF4097